MPTESILFSPTIDERELDKEVGTMDERLSSVGEDIGVSFDGDMSGLSPAGGGGGAAAGAGGPGVADAAVLGDLASKIPKPVAGVTAAAALPIALAGGIGASLLSEMGKASARLQTSASILGVARDNFFRAPGDLLDKEVARPISKDILELSNTFSDLFREGDRAGAIGSLFTGDDPRERTAGQRRFSRQGAGLGAIGGGLAGAKAGGIAGASLGSIIPGAGTAAGGTAGAIIGGAGGALLGAGFGGRVASEIGDKFPKWKGEIIDIFPNWLQNSPGIIPPFPSWGDVVPDFPGWPRVNRTWPGWPDVDTSWPGWPDISFPDNFWPTLDASNVIDSLTGGGQSAGDSGDSGWGGITGDPDTSIFDSAAQGGRVRRSGLAKIHKDEFVGDPDRLVSELASAVSAATGGGTRRSASMDTGRMEQKLDRLHDDLRRLESALSVEVQIGEETVARAASNGQRNGVADSNPKV